MKEHEHPYWSTAHDAIKSAKNDFGGYRAKGSSIPEKAKSHHVRAYNEEHNRLSKLPVDETGSISKKDLE